MHAALGRWATRVVAASVIVGALAYIPYRVARSDGYTRYKTLKHQLAELEADNLRVRRENHDLRREIRQLRDDLGTVAAVARDELGMVAPDEIVVQLAPVPARGAVETGEAPAPPLEPDPGTVEAQP